MLAAGTAAALVPIRSITYESKGEKISYKDAANEPGEVCVRLLKTLKGIQLGKIEDTQSWLYKVEKPELWGKQGANGAEETVDQLP